MTRTSRPRQHEPRDTALIWAALFLFLLPFLPHTVQYGDTGELVGHALTLRLPHPPGYPLFVWLNHLYLQLPLGLSPFAQAAALSAFFLSGAIALVAGLLPLGPGLTLAFFLGMNGVLLRQALLPDVFALHLFLCASLVRLALPPQSRPQRWFRFCAVAGLASANHHTVIFLAPLGLLFLRAGIRPARLALGLLLAAGIACAFYASLLLLDSASPYAWPLAPGIGALAAHVLRSHYGTFQLVAGPREANALLVYRQLLLEGGLLLAFLIYLGVRQRAALARWTKQPEAWLLCAPFLLYVAVFLPQLKIRPQGFGAFVVERFHALPLLLLGFGAAALLRSLPPRSAPRAALSMACLLPLAGWLSLPANQWQADTVLEDLVRNQRRLMEGDGKECVVLLSSSDSLWGALAYLDAVSPPSRQVLPASEGQLLMPAYWERLRAAGLTLPGHAGVLDVPEQLLRPNVSRCDIFSFEPYAPPPGVKATVLPVGRRYSEGEGTIFSAEGAHGLQLRLPPAGGRGYSLSKRFFAYYAHQGLAEGISAAQAGKWEEAAKAFERACAIAPYLIPPKANLCLALKKLGREAEGTACEAELRALEAREFPYLQ